jgi:type II secretory pathway pseudopilin PulG
LLFVRKYRQDGLPVPDWQILLVRIEKFRYSKCRGIYTLEVDVVGILAVPAIDRERRRRRDAARGFSMVDVLVTLAVIAVLIGLLLPTLSGVRETTRQVVCRSNVRQLGFGIALFADARGDKLPGSFFAQNSPHRTNQVRRDDPQQPWDGLGWLFVEDYLPAPGVFYCPSHTGAYPLARYADRWAVDAQDVPSSLREITANYQYRGILAGSTWLPSLRPRAALVTDSIRSQDDFNHNIGTNVLRADLSANWFADPGIVSRLPESDADPAAATKVNTAWDDLDQPSADPPQ